MKTRSLSSNPGLSRKRKTSNPFGAIFLGLGSNLGDRRRNLHRAVHAIAKVASVVACSSFYETEPVGYVDQPKFLNAVIQIRTGISARELLSRVKELETRLGRQPSFRGGPRLIDIDLLDVRGEVRPRGTPRLPHPRLHRRAFVLEPLGEIAPRWRHPVLQKTARQLLRLLPT